MMIMMMAKGVLRDLALNVGLYHLGNLCEPCQGSVRRAVILRADMNYVYKHGCMWTGRWGRGGNY